MRLAVSAVLSLLALVCVVHAQVEVTFDQASGLYQVFEKRTGYRLTGTLAQPATATVTRTGKEGKRTVHEISFQWNPGTPVEGRIKWYEGGSEVWFRIRYRQSANGHGIVFPDFTSFPATLHTFSYRDDVFSPSSFKLNETSTPWLFFDDRARSIVLSPASNFLIAKMEGDGKSLIGVGLNDRLTRVPRGLTEDSLIAFGEGIGQAWDAWGTALRTRYKRHYPDSNSDILLNKFGYWTDNGADYYYNYDQSRGYANTLLDLRKRYREEGIPLGYLQLDSWWYQKTIYGADGVPGSATKNPKLPEGSWNRYGGTYEYRAHPDLFPAGLEAFHKELGLPLAVHSRWIDRNSPYQREFKISGVGAVDHRFWNSIASYLDSSGVVCYEQDWLDHIYQYSPQMPAVAGVADAFADGMAEACKKRGLSMQYCMATPRFFLQAVKYDNLSTIRTSGDRFDRGKWRDFLFGSQFASEVGARPWCDVFKSAETGNLILSVLSTGPVGTGDRIGAEDKPNIMRAIRPDGVIIRPDRPAVPTDQTYLEEASGGHAPVVAATYTQLSGLTTRYVFAFPRKGGEAATRFLAKDVGVGDRAYLYDLVLGRGQFVDANYAIEKELSGDEYGYWMIAPITKSGIVLLGDLSKVVPVGRQRISALDDKSDSLGVHIELAPGEGSMELSGVSRVKPAVTGSGSLIHWDPVTGRFDVRVTGQFVMLQAKA